ncbi:MAG: hypothetical protein Aurels2KO_38540 [Aureliella sp.]
MSMREYQVRAKSRSTSPQPCRQGFSLMEMVVASASATVLLVGLASSVVVVSTAFDGADGGTSQTLDASLAVDELLSDLQYASTFTERTSTAVTFTVPDRDGNGVDETLRYAWDGTAGSPLTRRLNNSAPEPIISEVAALDLDYFTRTIPGLEAPVTFTPKVQYRDFSETRQTKEKDSLKIKSPSSTEAGDLLVLAVALDGELASSLKAPVTGWTLAGLDAQRDDVALGVWWRISDGNEPKKGHIIRLEDDTSAYAWMMRFTGHDTVDPIDDFQTQRGNSLFAVPPTAAVEIENSIVLTMGAFEGDAINPDSPGVSGQEIITFDEVGDYSGGAAYLGNTQRGASQTTYFTLKGWRPFVTATMVIKPSTEAQ